MTTVQQSIDTQHEDMIHDAQLDYYAKKLATCSSDRTIRIYDVSNGQQIPLATLQGHEGPVWQVAWSHPKFGVLLASCSYDGKVIVFRESPANNWTQIFVHSHHKSSVNSIAWAPYEFGAPYLACASSDGGVSIITHAPEGWKMESEFADGALGCNSVSWAPFDPTEENPTKTLVTGSCDNFVKIHSQDSAGKWQKSSDLPQGGKVHADWVRDVAWAPSSGLPTNLIASCSEDKTVCIFEQNQSTKKWEETKLEFTSPLWRVSWSLTGNVLAVSAGDHEVTLWKQSLEGEWQRISSVAEGGAIQAQ